MSDFETQLKHLFLKLDDSDERRALAALDSLQKLLKDNGSDFNTIAATLENGEGLFPPKLSALFRHLGDTPGPERNAFFHKVREFNGGKPVFKQLFNSLTFISLAQNYAPLEEERNNLARANAEYAKIIDKITKENDKLRRPPLIKTLQNLFSDAARNTAYRSRAPICVSMNTAIGVVWSALALTIASPICAPILGLVTASFIKHRDPSRDKGGFPAFCGTASSAFTIFRLAALLTGHVQYNQFYYDTPASMQNRVRMEAAHKIVYKQEERDGTASVRTTAIAQATYTEPSIFLFTQDKENTIRCVLTRYDYASDQLLVHERNNGKQGRNLVLSRDTDNDHSIRVAYAPQQRTEAKQAQNVKQANVYAYY